MFYYCHMTLQITYKSFIYFSRRVWNPTPFILIRQRSKKETSTPSTDTIQFVRTKLEI